MKVIECIVLISDDVGSSIFIEVPNDLSESKWEELIRSELQKYDLKMYRDQIIVRYPNGKEFWIRNIQAIRVIH